MTIQSGSMVNACGVSDYYSVFKEAPSPPEQVVCTTTSPSPRHLAFNTETELEHNTSHQHVVATVSTDESQGISPVKLNEFSPDGEDERDELESLNISDSSSTEALPALGSRRTDRSRKKHQPRSSRRTAAECHMVNWSGSCHGEEECCGTDDASDNSCDSEACTGEPRPGNHKQKMKKWKAMARGQFEEMLLECIVNTGKYMYLPNGCYTGLDTKLALVGPDNIPPNYENICLDRRVIDQVEHATMLGLKRPKAFSHGVLKNNKVTGAILYGPPGTGKSLLARGVAKQSGFNMLSISTSEVFQKCHGDDEKMIKAIFSMARKLYPSIVFLDEADAMLGERKAGEKRHLRAMLNKFLMEWDGITSGIKSPFILLATNRPNDLDPAVLQRAPVRIHLNVPTQKEREKILGLLLENEKLHGDIDRETLARLTPQYTGSDLKNLCVTAATECIAEQSVDTTERTLTRRHFMMAMQSIKATEISRTREQDLRNFQNNRQEQEEEE